MGQVTALQNISEDEAIAAFGEYLVQFGKITPDARNRASQIARESHERFERVLTKLGLITEFDLANALADHLQLPLTKSGDYPIQPMFDNRLAKRFLREGMFIPLREQDCKVAVAFVYPLDRYTFNAIQFAISRPVIAYVALPAEFESQFARLYGSDSEGDETRITQAINERSDEGFSDDLDRMRDSASDAPVIKLVNQLIQDAAEARASDIHIEPMENELRVRYRIDGVLQKVEAPPQQLTSAVISRVKLMTKLNIAEHRLPQDGRISFSVRGKDIDLRVSTVPASHGESVVLRILDREHIALDFATLGFDKVVVEPLRSLLSEPHGVFLVTGPTGSGKTTTLYAALLELNTVEKKILTIEDPIEYQLNGINQVQVKPSIGLSFASALRSFLRQDPDIMMIGEIRDLETAQIAIQAALTGHLILSTLHTNDAASAITRLLDMGVEDFLLSSTINGVLAQRLVRTLCHVCREAYEPVQELCDKLGLYALTEQRPVVLHRATGCEQCNYTGFRGRTSIVEILAMSDSLRQAILKSSDAVRLQEIACRLGMQTMRTHGLKKALAGITTVDEVMRVTRSV